MQTSPVMAIGDDNMDGGGGDMDHGDAQNKWSVGDEGVRATMVDATTGEVASISVDYTNKTPSNIRIHFGKNSKTSYIEGRSLSPSSSVYFYNQPSTPLPPVIATSGGNTNIEALRSYFTDEGVIRGIADDIGIPYNKLINGKYKLLLEPIAYFTYKGTRIAGTATEIAMYDRMLGGAVHSKIGLLTQMNLPLSMFLEKPQLGYPAWSGTTSWIVDNNSIITSLGLAIVNFSEALAPPPEILTKDYTYRTDTDVITSIEVKGGVSDPNSPVVVYFHINGTRYKVENVYFPDNESQLAWVKWHTPSTPQQMDITVEAERNGKKTTGTIHVTIEEITDNPPPDPKPNDRNPYFTQTSLPNKEVTESASWSVWEVYQSGGDWHHTKVNHHAQLQVTMDATPDAKVPTRLGKQMKSGYGYNNLTKANVTTSQNSAVTGAQIAISYFPEFHYETYSRLLKRAQDGLQAQFIFKPNGYSTYARNVHYTPVWYPDGNYDAYTYVQDCWTPVGMLNGSATDRMYIKQSVFSDWHIAPLK